MTDDLRGLLTDAVADVEPADRLGEIRARTSPPSRRAWPYAVGGTVLATAATVAAVVVLTGDGPPPAPAPALSPTPAASSTPASPVAIYYLGDTPRGPRLFREWRPGLVALTSGPLDPDYWTAWPAGAITSVGDTEAGVANVRLEGDWLAERPAGMSEEEARLALQQVVYTLRAGDEEVDEVQFRFGNRRARTVLGLPGAVTAAPELEVRSLVNISDPVEGRAVSGTFTARGVASSPEATVPWELLDGAEVVASGFATAEGWMDRLYPWETEVDVSELEPGSYTFVARTADDSDGEGSGPDVDTRTVVVE